MAATNIIEALKINDQNVQLEAVETLKKHFKHPDRIFSHLKLESILQSARVSLKNEIPETDFLFIYGTSLVGFIGKNAKINPEILQQIDIILGELKLKDERFTDELIMKLWSKFEKNSENYPDGLLEASKSTIERTVLEWVVGAPDSRMEFLSRMSANSPKLFQTLTSILYEVLVKTRGHVRVFEVTSSFVEAVKRECQKKEKSILGLYPRGCRRLVSLMRCPPELCCEGRGDVGKKVVSLLLEMFLTERKKALILLSHFTKWVRVFKLFLETNHL